MNGSTSQYDATNTPRTQGGSNGIFLKAFLRQPGVTGAVAPSSAGLAQALIGPFKARTHPARVLEVGAGTGAVTRFLGHEMRDDDTLEICEVQPALADYLTQHVLAQPQFAYAQRNQRIRLHVCRLQDMPTTEKFDFIVSGLPLTAFSPKDVADVFASVRRLLRPGGVLSYFEYLLLRKIKSKLLIGSAGRWIQSVSDILDDHIERFQFARHVVWRNLPPAQARYMRFD